MPKASIIIPAYNAEKYIGKTLDSILAQTFQDFECLVVDDGSSDGTVDVVKNYDDPRIKLFTQSNSGGPARPRNIGLKNSQGEYIFIFDSDDIMLPEKLEMSVKALDSNSDADILFSNFSSIDEQDKIIKSDFLAEYDSFWKLIEKAEQRGDVHFLTAQNVYPALVRTNFIGTSSVVLRASKTKNKYKFDEDLSNADDYLFWALFLKSHNAIYVNAMFHSYRIQTGGISNRGYLKRGPSRIKAIQQVKAGCDSVTLRRVLSTKLSKEYASMAYAYKKERNFKLQRHYSSKSIKEKINFTSLKLWIQSLLYPIIHF
jgi:glycosyltransferase involved in cell wall biosynthesis